MRGAKASEAIHNVQAANQVFGERDVHRIRVFHAIGRLMKTYTATLLDVSEHLYDPATKSPAQNQAIRLMFCPV